MKWIKDILGINRYSIGYDFYFVGTHMSGSFSGIRGGGLKLTVANRIAESCINMYGSDSHWVEPYNE